MAKLSWLWTRLRGRAALPLLFVVWVVVLFGGLAAMGVVDSLGACAVSADAVEDAGLDPTVVSPYGETKWQMVPFGPTCVASARGETLRSGPGVWPSVWAALVISGGAGTLWLLVRDDKRRVAAAG